MELAELHAEIDRLQAVDLSGVDPQVLGARMCELERAAHRLAAEKARTCAVFDAAEGYVGEGQTTTKAWLRTQTLAGHGEAAVQEQLARFRGRLPQLTAAWDAGQTTAGHVRAVQQALRVLPEALWSEIDGPITVRARVDALKEFRIWLRELAEAVRPSPKPRDEAQHEQRRLSVTSGYGGMTEVHARLTPEVGEMLTAAISAASRPDAHGEVRLPNQRTADALKTVLDLVLDSGRLPADGGQRPHLSVTVDLDQLTEQAQNAEQAQRQQPDLWSLTAEQRADRAAAGVAAAEAVRQATTGGPRYSWTGRATVAAGRRLACDGQLLPILTRGGRPLDVGRYTRVVSGAMRAFITARDRHCRWPGCTMPALWTQVHHVRHWRDGGRTDRANLLLLCDHHHHAAHNGRWTIILHSPGRITVRERRPGGPYYEIRNPPPPPGARSQRNRAPAA